MRTLLAGLTLLLSSPASSASPQPAEPPASLETNQVTIFDGKSLDGWRGDERFWSVENGAIVGRSTAEVPCTETTYLALTGEGRDFRDFDLSLEFWIDGQRSNSGVQFRSLAGPGHGMTGYQADLDAARDWTGGLYETGQRGVLARRGLRMTQNGGHTAYELLGDLGELSKLGAPGAWHPLRIRAQGRRIQIWVDDTLTCDLDDRESPIEGGALGFQLHKGPPMEVRFRNLEIERLAAPPSPDARFHSAQWIWSSADAATVDQPAGVERFERPIRARAKVVRATLTAACDDGVELSINDLVFAGGDDWNAPLEVELPPIVLTPLSSAKPLTLRADCWNSSGPAGFIARLQLEYEDGEVETIETNRWWKVVSGEAARPAFELGRFGAAPWGRPEGTSSGVPDLPLAASKLELQPGFLAEELLRVPRPYGSWVAMTVDPKGRLIVAAEADKGLFRVTLGEGGGGAEVEPLKLGSEGADGEPPIPGAQGLLTVGNDLYVMKNVRRAEDNGLYRARDANDDGNYEELELLQQLEGHGEHGPHAIRLAPDGQHLEVIAGNSTAIPAGAALRGAPRQEDPDSGKPYWPDDQLLPSLPDTFGHGNAMHDHGGWLARCDLDGQGWEILCAGIRNAYSFAYDANGERFTYDSDMEWDMGAPWYRAPAILHLVPGVEYGWRRGS
ncbi:MAG: family 16 glycoside hydrolase, partial [Planctomycetota bacterium]